MTVRRVRFALVGASGMAWAHGRALQQCPWATLVKVYSRDEERARQLGVTLGVAWTTHYEEVLDDRQIDAVDIVTEPRRHVELALAGWEHGKHLLVEKPLDEDLEAARRLMEVTEGASRCASVVSPRRFEPTLIEMKRAVDSGRFGEVLHATAVMMLSRDRAYYAHGTGWRADYGGALFNQAIHWVDVLIWMLGVPEQVEASVATHHEGLPTYDTAVVWARHPHGALSMLAVSTACPQSLPETYAIYGRRGRATYGPSGGWWGRLGAWLRRDWLNHERALERQIADVAGSILDGRPPAVSIRDGYAALEVVKRCEAAWVS